MAEPTKDQKLAKWEVVSLAKEIFSSHFTMTFETSYDETTNKYLALPNEEIQRKWAKWSIEAAEIFYEELNKKEGAI